jgi:hypothetical protein
VLALPSFACLTSDFWEKKRYISVAIMLSFAVLVKDSAATSKSRVISIWKSRDNDMVLVQAVVDRYLKGSEIIAFAEQYAFSSNSDCRWWFDVVFDYFINYYLGYKANIIKKCSSPDNIPKKSVVIHYKTTARDEKIFTDHDCLKNFRLLGKCRCGIDIYVGNETE